MVVSLNKGAPILWEPKKGTPNLGKLLSGYEARKNKSVHFLQTQLPGPAMNVAVVRSIHEASSIAPMYYSSFLFMFHYPHITRKP